MGVAVKNSVRVKLNVRVDHALDTIARKLGTSKALLLSRAAEDYVSYHRWKEKAVAAGFASGERHGWLTAEQMQRDFARRRATHVRKRQKAA